LISFLSSGSGLDDFSAFHMVLLLVFRTISFFPEMVPLATQPPRSILLISVLPPFRHYTISLFHMFFVASFVTSLSFFSLMHSIVF